MSEEARRLLRAMVDDVVMVSRQTEDEEDVIGASVTATTSVAMAAGIPDDHRYDEVLTATLSELLAEEALVRDEELSHVLSPTMGSPEAYKVTRRGIELLP